MKNKFRERSSNKELLDSPDIPETDLEQNLKELEVINSRLGGYSPVFRGIEKLISDRTKTYHLTDIGCGGGDTLKTIARRARKRGFKLRLTGIDLKQEAIDYAKKNCSDYKEINFRLCDYRMHDFEKEQADIITASLFCHHLTNEELIEFIVRTTRSARLGVVINDLHRHAAAYYAIKWLTRFFSKSYLVKNDAPLSVLRGFKRNELINIIQESTIKNNFSIQWLWAFRWLLVIRREQNQ